MSHRSKGMKEIKPSRFVLECSDYRLGLTCPTSTASHPPTHTPPLPLSLSPSSFPNLDNVPPSSSMCVYFSSSFTHPPTMFLFFSLSQSPFFSFSFPHLPFRSSPYIVSPAKSTFPTSLPLAIPFPPPSTPF